MASIDLKPSQNILSSQFNNAQKSIFDEASEKSIAHFFEFGKQFTEETFKTNMNVIQSNSQETQKQIKTLNDQFKSKIKNQTILSIKFQHLRHINNRLKIPQQLYTKLLNYIDKKLQNVNISIYQKNYARSKNIKKISINLLSSIIGNIRFFKINTKLIRNYLPKKLLIGWKNITKQEIRQNITETVNQKTDTEIQKMQKEYESIIIQMQGLLERRLIELKVEEEQHKELVQRYEAMTEKKPIQQISRH